MSDIISVRTRYADGHWQWRWVCNTCWSAGQWIFQSEGAALHLGNEHKRKWHK